MNNHDFIFDKMCKEAMEELAAGDKTWKEIETNTLLLACIGMVYNSLMHRIGKLSKPLWWFAGSVFAAFITYLVSVILAGL